MIQQRDGSSLLTTDKNQNDNIEVERERNRKCCFCCPPTPTDDESHRTDIPPEIIMDHIAPFLDRRTYNSCLLLCRKSQQILKASWRKCNGNNKRSSNLQHRVGAGFSFSQQQQQLPPWPRKIVARDPSCRVRCLTFSEDNAMLSCGCSDGNIRSWDVRIGELPIPSEGHWPDEAVVAIAYDNGNNNDTNKSNSNSSDRKLLASSSTDGTIRIWKIHYSNCPPRTKPNCHQASTRSAIKAEKAMATTTTKTQKTSFGDDNSTTSASSSLVTFSCILCIPSDHAVSLHFSPDDSYLVSGHLRMRNEQDVLPISTIEIREVRRGLLLRRLDGGGVPVGFVPSPSTSLSPTPERRQQQCHRFYETSWEDRNEIVVADEEKHQLISTCGPNACLKMWSWNRTHCVTSEDEDENEYENHDPKNLNHATEQQKTVLDSIRSIQIWNSDRFNTVLPVTTTPIPKNRSNRCSESVESDENEGADYDIIVAMINNKESVSKDSFSVWNTRSPNDRKIFRNKSPYEIQFSPDGTKIASVDDFNTVKVWRINDGALLKTFPGTSDEILHKRNHSSSNNIKNCCSDCRIPVNHGNSNNNSSIRYEREENEKDSDNYFASYREDYCGNSEDGGGMFPIHELVFSKDSSTVAVISRCYNEVHLFST